MSQDTHKHLPAVDITDDLVTEDGGGNSALRVSGDLNLVSLPTSYENLLNEYNEVTAVVKDTITTVVTFTASLTKSTYLQFAEAGGSNIGIFQIEIDGVIEAKKRTYFGGPLDAQFQFYSTSEAGILLDPGAVVRIRVEHKRPNAGDFEGRLQILEIG